LKESNQRNIRNRNARKALVYAMLVYGAILSTKSQITSNSDDLAQNRKSKVCFFLPTTACGFGSGVFGMSSIKTRMRNRRQLVRPNKVGGEINRRSTTLRVDLRSRKEDS